MRPAMAAKMKEVRVRVENVAAVRPVPAISGDLEVLTVALQRAFQMTEEDALAVAEVVGERFDGVREVNDDTLDAEVRSLFYTLEGRKLLAFRREEYENAEGQKRRAFWWRLRPEVVAELTAAEPAVEEDVYASLPAECWRRGTPEAAEA